MAGITTYLSILTMNVNGLNTTTKRHCLANWIKKEDRQSLVYKKLTLLTKNKNKQKKTVLG
jgi:exonuclease III